jgi:hypothetical protein
MVLRPWGVKALAMPVGDLVSDGAYMVMAGLAWSLKAWSALVLPEGGRWAEKYRAEKRSLLRMEFSTFCVALIQVPCQIGRGARRIVYRLLSWNPWQGGMSHGFRLSIGHQALAGLSPRLVEIP